MKFKVIVIGVALLLVALTLGTGVAFGSNTRFLRGEAAVHFPDANLEAAIRYNLEKPEGDIHVSDLEKLDKLNANHRNITDLTGLEYCVNLCALELWDNQISDLAPILNLPNLEALALNGNRIRNIPDLSGLPKLTYLWLDRNGISDITPLAKITDLMVLSLGDNQISDISPLANLSITNCLSLRNNRVSDISVLAGISTHLLDLTGNNIEDISPLVSLNTQVPGEYYDIILTDNPLNRVSQDTYILQLNLRGVLVDF